MSDCLFCNFATGKIKKEFVLETESMMVFSDIAPVAPVHLLVVPKRHIPELVKLGRDAVAPLLPTLSELDKFVWNDVMAVVLKLIKQNGLGKKGYRIVINGGGAQAIDHLHVHLLGGITKDKKL